MQITIEGWDPVDKQPVRGVLQGLDRAQTQAAEQVTVTLSGQAAHTRRVTLKQNPTLLHAGSSTRVGAAVWDGAYVLAAWLDAQPPGSFAGLRCVELGCGLGLPGLVLARLGAADVFLTDKPALLVGARGNAAKNKLLAPQPAPSSSQQKQQQPQQPGCVVQVVGLDWEQPESLAAAAATITAGGRVDLIVASDCIYPDPNGSVPSSSGFMAAVTALATPGHTRILTTFEARSDELREALLAAAAAVQPSGCEAVRLPLDELPQGFRGQHIELYQLRLPGEAEAT